MNANIPVGQPNGKSDMPRAIRRRVTQVVVQFLIIVAILFTSSGRVDWAMAWALIGVYVAILAINLLVVLPKSPEMIAERGQIKEGTKGWDKLLGAVIGLAGLAALIVTGLDERFAWSPPFALVIQLVALAFVALGQGLFSWAMASNKFFSGVVRIQEERGHTVATGGPYQYVRHPGYVGYITFTLATPLALGSAWALIPAGLTALAMVVRTALEDKTLLEELGGYTDYAGRVRYRLLPGVW